MCVRVCAPLHSATAWKEFTAPDGRKYYYNRITKESKWTLPDEMKAAQQQAAAGAAAGADAGEWCGGVRVCAAFAGSMHRP